MEFGVWVNCVRSPPSAPPAAGPRLIELQTRVKDTAGAASTQRSLQPTPAAVGAAAAQGASLRPPSHDSRWACMGTGAQCGATIGRACCEGGCSSVLPDDASTCRCINGPESISMEWLEGT